VVASRKWEFYECEVPSGPYPDSAQPALRGPKAEGSPPRFQLNDHEYLADEILD